MEAGEEKTTAWLPGFIAAHNARFGREPANAKDLHRPLTAADDLDEILAWREHRTATHNLTLHYDRRVGSRRRHRTRIVFARPAPQWRV